MSNASISEPNGMRPLHAALRLTGALLVAGMLVVGCQKPGTGNEVGSGARDTTTASAKQASPAERGKYLTIVGGCNDCHTPLKMGAQGPEPDMSRMLSGHPQDLKLAMPKVEGNGWMWVGASTNTAFAGPWGISFAMNLTPDSATGMGLWSEDMFMKTLRSGKHWGVARPIMPPMPWQSIAMMTDEDLKAVYAFLRTIPPISNKVPDYIPPAGAPAAGQADTTHHM